jgi:uncharacterized DUF497 family protein
VDRAALKDMEIGFDPAKSTANVADPSRGFGFELAARFDFEAAMIVEDDRFDYGETRHLGIGPLDGRVHVIVFTLPDPILWVISLRKANKREIRHYAEYVEGS